MALLQHLPILQVVVPLISAPLCLLFFNRRAVILLALAAGIIGLAISLLLLQQVASDSPISYAIGGWTLPWGIEYRVDRLTAFVLLVINGINLLALVYSPYSVTEQIPARSIPLFYTGWQLCITGLNGMVLTGDAFNLFVFLEISSLATYLLISAGPERQAPLAAFRYLIMGSVGATFILIAIGLLYMQTGTLNMADIAQRLPDIENRTEMMALAFFTAGVGVKVAMMPFHAWLPNAYRYAPHAATVLLAGTATKVAIYAMLRFVFSVFGFDFTFTEMPVGMVLLILSIFGILLAPLAALGENDLKKMLAWSSVAQISYMTIGISLGSAAGITAAIIHLFNHAIIKSALFMAVGAIALRAGTTNIDSLHGIGRKMPKMGFVLFVGGLGLVGIPGTAGFISKWYLITGALERGWWWLAMLLLFGSLFSAAYVWKIVGVLWDPDAIVPPRTKGTAGPSEWVPVALLVIAILWFGIDSSFTSEAATAAAYELLGGKP
ncbi:MAG: monovalent cation/H+ antiporter subunit D family protein [Pseudomonadota bacterium]|nr:monovalent cation/H+ antiporter subunit D family protein [Pseudomonadota bacterium]